LRERDVGWAETHFRVRLVAPHENPTLSTPHSIKKNHQLNDLLSLGLHRVWKRMAVTWSGARPGDAALDVCCGSGDVALLLAARVRAGGRVVGLDFAPAMLADAAGRAARAGRGGASSSAFSPGTAPAAVEWVEGDATSLPFPDAAFHAATLSYGLRNVSDPRAALAELARVLKPGGKAAILDFNHSPNPVIDGLQGALLEGVVVPVARAAGVGPQYAYLRPSIAAFPTGPELESLALEAGFASAVHHEIGLGLMGCLVAAKAR
jgi:demethylphylloquinol methyltransferase